MSCVPINPLWFEQHRAGVQPGTASYAISQAVEVARCNMAVQVVWWHLAVTVA